MAFCLALLLVHVGGSIAVPWATLLRPSHIARVNGARASVECRVDWF